MIYHAEANVRGTVPEARLMFLEPDVDRRIPARELGGFTSLPRGNDGGSS
jgi:hypothetical protein